MKKAILPIVLIVAFFQQACNKDDNSIVTGKPEWGWNLSFIVVDSLGDNVFDPLPINFQPGDPFPDTIPFNPAITYWVDGLGQKHNPIFGGRADLSGYGMIFNMGKKHRAAMYEERDSTNSYQWLLYLTSSRPPDTIRFKDPFINGLPNEAEFITLNSDTIFKRGGQRGLSPFKIQYP